MRAVRSQRIHGRRQAAAGLRKSGLARAEGGGRTYAWCRGLRRRWWRAF